MLLNVLFFGSSDYCLPVLQLLIKNFQLIATITKKNSSVEKFSLSHNMERSEHPVPSRRGTGTGIKVFTPTNIKELSNLAADISRLRPDLAVVADYGLVIPPEIFNLPKYKTINIHFSKLPELRGPSPVQYTILLGLENAFISVIKMDKKIDAGDVIWQQEIKKINNETSQSLYIKLFNIISSALPDIIDKYTKNELTPQKQDNSLATYTKHFTREDGFIPFQLLAAAVNWKNTISVEKEIKEWQLIRKIPQLLATRYQIPEIIDRACRAFFPWPGVWTEITLRHPRGGRIDSLGVEESAKEEAKRLKILKAHLIPLASQGQPLGGYRLVIDLVQLEGKKPVSWKQFRQGYPDFLS